MTPTEHITWLGHDGFKIVAGGKVVYLDPFQLRGTPEPADVVLVTHEHFDHCSPKDLDLIVKPSTVLVAAAVCERELAGRPCTFVRPGDVTEVDGLTIEAVPAYNIGKSFHPAGEPRVGYVLTVEGQRIYHAGDTDDTPELRALRNIDVALVPVSGMYVMTAEEAAAAVNAFRPKLAVPMHYGAIIGSRDDAERFRRASEVPVEIFELSPSG